MKKILFVILLVLVVTGCEIKDKEINNDPVNELLENMSLEDKIGQMLMISYRSPIVDTNLINILNEVKPGGFILFSENFESYEQTINFITEINETSDIPMFISIDQEGGRVQRLNSLTDNFVTVFPSMLELGNTNNSYLSYQVGRALGEELGVFGINMNFAPVLDIYSNPNNTVIGNRAFGTSSQVVSKMALSFAKGLESTGIIPIYKHFPGHGDTLEDSHYDLPIINKTKEELMNFELLPFINAINKGADVIMIGHLSVPKITKDNTPASLSKEIITDLLIKELGFDGLVITDALNMDALTKNYTEKEIYVNAINAGADILLMPTSIKDAVQIIKEAVIKRDISEDRINISVEKILRMKEEKLSNIKRYSREYLGSKEHLEIVSKIGG